MGDFVGIGTSVSRTVVNSATRRQVDFGAEVELSLWTAYTICINSSTESLEKLDSFLRAVRKTSFHPP